MEAGNGASFVADDDRGAPGVSGGCRDGFASDPVDTSRPCELGPAMWFMALREITGELPIREQDRGNIEAMRVAWIDWGERNGYI